MTKVVQPRRFKFSDNIIVIMALLILAVYMLTNKTPGPGDPRWSGNTMGTVYTIKAAGSLLTEEELQNVQAEVTDYLDRINRRMSTYVETSDISRFNASESTEAMGVNEHLYRVARFAWSLSEQTDGAYDPTVEPLVNLWGFGPEASTGAPSDEEIRNVLDRVGYQHLTFAGQGVFQKDIPTLEINLDSVAKGYAVDGVVDLLANRGLMNVFVEIGGEVYASGMNSDRKPWRVGIETPSLGSKLGESIESIVELSGVAMATSGDYRNFIEADDGTIHSHIIDPRTGRPVKHGAASVTVIADKCMTADALATTLYVLGPEEGMQLIEAWQDAEALFLVRNEDGTFSEVASEGFETFRAN